MPHYLGQTTGLLPRPERLRDHIVMPPPFRTFQGERKVGREELGFFQAARPREVWLYSDSDSGLRLGCHGADS